MAELSDPETATLHRPSGDGPDSSGVVDEHLKGQPSMSTHTNKVTSKAPTPLDSATIPAGSSAAQPLEEAAATMDSPVLGHAAVNSVNGVTSYGTRSRIRGGARPNYADDRDFDLELDLQIPHANVKKSKRSASYDNVSRSSPESENGPLMGASNRKASSTVNGSGSARHPLSQSTTAKETIPGTSTWSAVDGNDVVRPTSKKRKVPGGVPSTHPHASSVTAASQSNSRLSTSASSKRSSGSRNDSSANGRESNIYTFDKTGSQVKEGRMVADDGTTFEVNDHVYLVCEPPGDPYYICRIMEFQRSEPDNPDSPVESLRVNWYYRPRDVQRFAADTRQLFATMHSDICPLTSLRGKCNVKHRHEIEDLDEYRKKKDSFWFNQVHDRFIHRYYEVIPTSQVVNVPDKVKKALDDWWKYVVVETTRVKELTSAVKSCKRCTGYCASDNSVECAVCHNTYHMNCVRPPLLKKPSRGFAWACGPCSRAQERKMEARNIPLVGESTGDAEEEDFVDEEEEDPAALVGTTAPSPSGSNTGNGVETQGGTQAEIALAKMWPMRYLGIHCRVEDALQRDDRAIYPRASSRLGPRHQANVTMWPGRPVELVKPRDIRKRYAKTTSHKKDGKFSKETVAELEADRAERAKRPKWVQDEPPGYVPRGEDHNNKDPRNTAYLIFKMPAISEISERGHADEQDHRPNERIIDEYMRRAQNLAESIGVPKYSTNFLDKALELLQYNRYDIDAALKQLKDVDRRRDLREPNLNKEESKRFDEGVALYGSDLRLVRQHVRTVPHADIVRYYYLWKKTEKGRQIWGHYEGRRGTKKKMEANAAVKQLDDVADERDDSAFDEEKAVQRKHGFQCKFCSTRQSRQWRRAPNTAPGTTVTPETKGGARANSLIVALCQRCAGLWRKYAIKWENIEEVAKKVAQGGGRAMKRRIDEELLSELIAANEAASVGSSTMVTATGAAIGAPAVSVQAKGEPPKKKLKASQEKELTPAPVANEPVPKKKIAPPPPPKLPTPPPVPDVPEILILDCDICFRKVEQDDPQYLCCKDCRLTVHRQCYGVEEQRNSSRWVCDGCANEKNPQVSLNYECVLCPVNYRPHELLKPPKKPHHKKKSEHEREKERLDKEERDRFTNEWRQKQISKNRPVEPREALKRTDHNNWVHVTCAVWTPEVKFSNAATLQVAEGIGNIPTARYDQICKLCRSTEGACVSCFQCHATFHIGCAHAAEFIFGFDIAPVKGSRRDVINTVTLGSETGSMTPAIWCRSHQDSIKTIMHPMFEMAGDSSMNALQLYVQTYKQADLTLTGTVRKASLINQNQSTKAIAQNATQHLNTRRASLITASVTSQGGNRASRSTPNSVIAKDEEMEGEQTNRNQSSLAHEGRRCITCKTDVSPKWYKTETAPAANGLTVQQPPADDGHQTNSILHDASDGQDLNLRSGLGLLLNGNMEPVDARQVDVDAPVSSNTAAPAEANDATRTAMAYQCHKCHHRKLHPSSRAHTPPAELHRQNIHDLTRSPPPPAPPRWPAEPLPPIDQVHGWPHREPNGYGHPLPPVSYPSSQHLPAFHSPPPRQVNGYGPPSRNTSPYMSRQQPLPPALPAPLLSGQAPSYQSGSSQPIMPPSPHRAFNPSNDPIGPSFERRVENSLPAPSAALQRHESPLLSRISGQRQESSYLPTAGVQQSRAYGYSDPAPSQNQGTPTTTAGDIRPATAKDKPREMTDFRVPLAGGASASPNLANLLH